MPRTVTFKLIYVNKLIHCLELVFHGTYYSKVDVVRVGKKVEPLTLC